MSRKMPAATQLYAEKFAANWKAQNPDEEDDSSSLDDSLTNLQWLHSINIQDIAPGSSQSTPPSPSQSPYSSDSEGRSVTSDFCSKAEASSESKIDYKNDANHKPPYSYATLICMAMRETNKSKITLSAIYKWIKENFMYYRLADPTWQNSIRHNLSLNKCFSKVPRRKDEPGKGGFWRIDPAYADMFVDGVFKRRRGVNTQKISKKTLTKGKDKAGKNVEDIGSKRAFAVHQQREGARPKKSRPNAIKIKTEPSSMCDDDFLDEEIPPFSGGLKGDFSWMSVLTNYELDESIKDIADAHGISLGGHSHAESPVSFDIPTCMSPSPLSESADDTFKIDPELDLTIQGISIFPLRQHLSTQSLSPTAVNDDSQCLFNMPPSPNAMYIDEHPWAETGSDGLPCFDIDENNNTDCYEDKQELAFKSSKYYPEV